MGNMLLITAMLSLDKVKHYYFKEKLIIHLKYDTIN